MPGTKEIRNKISSVKSTQKITKAMEMVAASKMRRAQERMRLSRPYAEKIRNVIGHLKKANPDYKHPYLIEREAQSIGIIVVSSDRGLCGALNTNVFKTTLMMMREWQGKGAKVNLCLLGSKGVAFFRRLGAPVLASVTGLGDKPHVRDLLGSVKVMLDAYKDGTIDRLFIVNAEFVNTMTQKPTVTQLLPAETVDVDGLQDHWDYIYEPSAAELLDGVLMRYIESQVYRGAVESVACEMAARMVAMKAASDNAGKLIGDLQLVYNKARQAAITKELAEIVGGAAAV
ncbi:MAG: F0F1 ATP synthase subunit gamma [Gammaproteobacteria bacterium]|jgi:F-type H+-transporting ATPase subunit gamma|nr:F0F1 ATP synthase subunit gamma [Gammaproteobacteria bacterium]